MAAVLAGVAVALKNVVPGEFDFLFGKAVEHQQEDDARDADFKRNCGDGFRVRFLCGKIAPLVETECLESAVGVAEDHLRVPLKNKGEGAAGGANIDRLPEPVEH